MAPSATPNGKSETTLNGVAQPTAAKASDFDWYRELVPVAAQGEVTFLNASYAPPGNLIVAAAINKFTQELLYDPHPKPTWQTGAQRTRDLLARYINAGSPDNVALTRDTTEGLGYIIGSLDLQPGDNVIILDTEHPNHAFAWMAMRDLGIEIRQVPTLSEAERTGRVVAADAETFRPYVDDRTRAIGLSSVMFHSGQFNDVGGIAKTFRPRNIHVLADITQQVGFAETDVQALGVSAAAFSLHKGLNCPTGLGALYVNPDILESLKRPPVVGAGAAENLRPDLLVTSEAIKYHPTAQRFNHLNMALLQCAAANAFLCFYLDRMGPRNVQEHLFSLGDALRQECRRLGIRIVGPVDRSQHAPHLYILDLMDPAWVEHLAAEKIQVTPYRLGIRVSFGFYNNLHDVHKLALALEKGLTAGLLTI